MKLFKKLKHSKFILLSVIGIAAVLSFAPTPSASAATIGEKSTAKYSCGGGGESNENSIKTSINLGCKGKGNAIVDATFAIIRFLTTGVGLVVVASLVFAGVQYTMARDDPNAVAQARGRIQSSLIALLIFVFAYAMLNYVVPAGFFKL